MKQCISRIKRFLIHLWQTLKEYVCRKKTTVQIIDSDRDGNPEITIEMHDVTVNKVQINNIQGGISNDREPNSLLESSGSDEIQQS